MLLTCFETSSEHEEFILMNRPFSAGDLHGKAEQCPGKGQICRNTQEKDFERIQTSAVKPIYGTLQLAAAVILTCTSYDNDQLA